MKDKETKNNQLVAIASDNNTNQKENPAFPERERKQEDSYGSCGWFGEGPTYTSIIYW